MKKVILSLSVGILAAVVQAANIYRVTPDAPGGGTGLSWDSPMTINEAMDKLSSLNTHGHTVLCKAGVYVPKAKFFLERNFILKGGLAGTDDTTLDPNGTRTIIDCATTSITPIFEIKAGDPSTIEKIEIRNAYFRAVHQNGSGGLKFTDCVFDSCGTNYTVNVSNIPKLRGGAGRFQGNGHATIIFEDCVFSRNMYQSDKNSQLGYGVAVGFYQCKRVTFDNCLFVSNGLGKACLKSGGGVGVNDVRGAAIYSESPVTIRNTEFRANRAGISDALGGVVYIKEAGSDSAFTNCLFLANSCEYCNTGGTDGNNGVLVFRKKSTEKLDVVNCTFAYNFTDGVKTSAGIDIGSGTANIKNTIFYGNRNVRTGSAKDIYTTAAGATANIDYCLFEENSTACISGAGTINKGANNVFGDPKFVRAITDEEIASVKVRYDTYYGYSADAYETVFSKADVHATSLKLAVDKGDPALPYDNEPKPNGKRINLGYYGNTPEAYCSLRGMRIIVR